MLKKFLYVLSSIMISSSIIAMEPTLTIAQIIEYHKGQPLEQDHEFTLNGYKFVITKIIGNTALFKSLSKDLHITGEYFSFRKEWYFKYISKDIKSNEKTNSFSFTIKES